VLYLDSSAVVKLVAREPETEALVARVRADPLLVSSALTWTEVLRAVRRARGNASRAERVLDGIGLVPIDDGIVRAAATLRPVALRTLDAIHVATAASLGADVSEVVTYDVRLASAASDAGLVVVAPGRSDL
jgi:predicted nucleic acid-binding protein